MDTQVLLCFIGVTVAIALGGALLTGLRNLRRRRARYLYHAQAYARRQNAAPLRGSVGSAEAAAIRRHAERCAQRDWHAGTSQPQPPNPHAPGTPQAVLWYASYQLALHELLDAQGDPTPAKARRGTTEPATSQ